MKPHEEAAFPTPAVGSDREGWSPRQSGMALRDYFAAAALMGPIADLCGTASEHAQIAYEYADAMLAERAK